MVINTAYYLDSMTDINGTPSVGGVELDRVIAHELTHGVMAANVVQFSSLPMFLTEGMAELVHGVDDFRYNEIMNLVNTECSVEYGGIVMNQKQLLDAVFNLEFTNASVGTYTYGGGYLLLRYMAKQCADSMTTDELLALNMPALFSTVLGEEWDSDVVAFADGNSNEPNVASDSTLSNNSLAVTSDALLAFDPGGVAGTDTFQNVSFIQHQDQNKSSLFITGNV